MSKFLNISTDNTLGGASPSDEIVASQKAIKDYVDNNAGASYTAGTGIDITSNTISVTAPVLQNHATANQAIQISKDTPYAASSGSWSVSIGNNAYSTSANGIAIGRSSYVIDSVGAIAIGTGSYVYGMDGSIILGGGSATPTAAGTFCVSLSTSGTLGSWHTYTVVSADGTIPAARHADTTSAAQGQVLTLDSNLKPAWASAGGGGSSTLAGLTDVTITSATSGQVLVYNGSVWENVTDNSTIDCGTMS